jgi:Cdc6-like AAA superfamily ATPase
MPPWVLWVHGQFRFDRRSKRLTNNTGNPGCGKTVLASSVIEELVEEEDSRDGLNEICYFFFNYNDSQSSTIEAAYRSALAQILHKSRDDSVMLDKFLFGQYNMTSSSGQKIASSTELLDLIPSNRCRPIFYNLH